MRTTASAFVTLLHEQRYRLQFLAADANLSTKVIAFAALATMATTRNDFLLVKTSTLLVALLAARVCFVIVTVATIVRLRRETRARRHHVLYGVWTTVQAAMVTFINLSRWSSGEVQGPIIGAATLITILYFALRGPIIFRTLGSILATFSVVALVSNPNALLSSAARATALIAIMALNVIGFVTARAFEEQRRKRFDAELQEKQARKLLDQKILELAEEKKHAEAMARARTAFLAAMSHEFRTPMNAVLGFSELILALRLDAKAHEYANSIRESARGLLGLLNDVLDFAKIDADKLLLASVPFDLRGLANSVIAMMEPIASTRSIAVELVAANSVPDFVMGDDLRLRQVLVNLLSNAIKFTEKGVVRLNVSAIPVTDKLHRITFAVEDTGIGMTKEVLARLFHPFEQGDQGMTRRHQGTGLGLAISKRIVQTMGGDITVESEVGRGSKFSFTIELSETAPTTPATGRGIRELRATFSILVVDDNAINRRVAAAMLDRIGYAADLVDGGSNALLAVMQKDYDIVFMDLHMPDMNGIEATHAIRKKLEGRPIPRIVAMTASVFEEDREACRQAGMQDFVAKPIDLAQLDKVLTRIAKQRMKAAPSMSAVVLEPEALENLWELEKSAEPGFVVGILRDFLEDSPRRIERMRAAFEAKNAKDVRFEAHALKSTCKSIGATEMSALCARIEAAARAEEMVKMHEWIEALAAELTRVEPAIAAEIVKTRG